MCARRPSHRSAACRGSGERSAWAPVQTKSRARQDKTMSTGIREHDLGVMAAMTWLMVWAIGFFAIGINHSLARRPDSGRLFLVAAVLAAFLGSVWFVSSQRRSSFALASNVIMVGAILLAAVVVSRNPALMALYWSRGQHNLFLFASWVWVAVIWLSIICAAAVAEVHHVVGSRAR